MSNYVIRGCIEERDDDGSVNVNSSIPDDNAQFWGLYRIEDDGCGHKQEVHQADFNDKEDAIVMSIVLDVRDSSSGDVYIASTRMGESGWWYCKLYEYNSGSDAS